MTDEEEAKFIKNLDAEYANAKRLLRGLVGNYSDLIGEATEQEARMCAVAYFDERSGLIGKPVADDKLDELMKDEKDYKFITDYYLYCNWRVWATYRHNEELAKKYQAVCDKIDDYVFDNWDKDMIRYFVENTD